MNKKGISPLIAIILLVGFTILLAVIIMNFSGISVSKWIKEAEQKESLLSCVNLNIKIIQEENNFIIMNSNNLQIENFILQWYDNKGTALGGYYIEDTKNFNPALSQGLKNKNNFMKFPILPYDQEKINILLPGSDPIDTLEFIPVIKEEQEYVVCPENSIKVKYNVPSVKQQLVIPKEIVQGIQSLSDKISYAISNLVFPWEEIKIEPAEITSKYVCNGMEFNINNVASFSFNIYGSIPSYTFDIDYLPNERIYCPWCYNKVQDYDEIGIDCGGSCKACGS